MAAIIGAFSWLLPPICLKPLWGRQKDDDGQEEGLRLFEAFFGQTAVGLWVCDCQGHFLRANGAYCNMLGYAEDELIGKPFAAITDAEDLVKVMSLMCPPGDVRQQPLELRHVHKNGQTVWVSLGVGVVYGETGQPKYFTGQVIDICACKGLAQERQCWQDIFRYAKWGVAISSADGLNLELINPAFAAMHGYSVGELTGQPLLDVFAPQVRAELPQHIRHAHEQGHHVFESLHIHKDGGIFPVEIDVSVVYDETGGMRCRVVNVKDISQRKQSERVLEQSEKLFHSIVDYVPAMVFLKRADELRFELINQRAEDIMGYTQEEMLGKTDYDFFPKDEADFFTAKDREVLASRKPLNIPEEFILTKKRGTRILQTSKIGLYDEDGKATHLLGVSLDITEQRLAEAALRTSEANLNRAQAVGQIGSWTLDMRVNVLTWSPETYRIFGVEQGLPLTYEAFIAFVHPDDRHYVDSMWQRALTGEGYDIEHRLLVGEEVRWVREKADLEFAADGQVIGGIGIVQDITERKLAEAALRESEEKLRGMFELSPLGIVLTDMEGHYIEFNQAFQDITGYGHDELAQLDYWQLTPKKYAASEAKQLELLNSIGHYGPYEKESIRKDGQVIPLRMNGMLVKGRDGQKYIWSLVEDVSEHYRLEEHLRARREERQRLLEIQASILDALPANILLIDRQGVIQQTNRRWDLFADENNLSSVKAGKGCNYLEICSNTIGDDGYGAKNVPDGIRRVLNGASVSYTHEYACQLSERKAWFLLQVVPISANHLHGAVVMHLDITESRLAKEQLHVREETFRALVENSPDIIIRFDKDCRYLYVSPAAESMLGVPAQTFIGQPSGRFGLSGNALKNCQDTIRSVFADGLGRTLEFSFNVVPLEPRERHFHARFVPEHNPQGDVVSVLAVMRDITETKRFEISLRQSRQQLREMAAQAETASEQERKRIAREVHDELGQVLTALRMDVSLLRLRFGNDNPALLEKIRSMLELVDRAITSVRNVATNLRPTALDMGVVDSLKWLCNEVSRHTNISCKLHSPEDTYGLDETRAVQVFRIVQESLTNIARHAEATQADIRIERRDDNLWLEIKDNGKGFDTNNPPKLSFGLLGIRERAIVLGGDIRIMSAIGEGTTISLLIPIE